MGEREAAGLRQACDSACTTSMVSAPDRYRPLGVALVRRGQESSGPTGIATNETEGVGNTESLLDVCPRPRSVPVPALGNKR